MIAAQHLRLPDTWEQVLERYAAPGQAQALLTDARRYLAANSSERVPVGREAETLRNLVYAYVDPARREAALLELAIGASREHRPSSSAASVLLALGSAATAGIALWRLRR